MYDMRMQQPTMDVLSQLEINLRRRLRRLGVLEQYSRDQINDLVACLQKGCDIEYVVEHAPAILRSFKFGRSLDRSSEYIAEVVRDMQHITMTSARKV